MGAGHRDERHVRPGQPPRRAGDRAGWLAPVWSLVPPARGEERLGLAERGVGRVRALGTDHDDEVGGPGAFDLCGQEVGLVEHAPVQLGRHHQGGRPDPRERPDALRDLHQRHRVHEGVAPHPTARHHGRTAVVASSIIAAASRNPTIQSVPDEDPTASAPRTAGVEPAGVRGQEVGDEPGHRLEELAPAGVLEPDSSERRRAARGPRDDGGRHARACGAITAEGGADQGPGPNEAGQEIVPRRREPGAEPGQAAGRARHRRRVAADGRIAQEPGRGRRDPGNPRSEPVRPALVCPEEREQGLAPLPPPRRWRASPARGRPGPEA